MLEPGYAFKVFFKRAAAFLSYKFRNDGKSSSPESITFFLTYKCNLRCKMCGQWGDAGSNKDFNPEKVNAAIDIDSYIRILEEFKREKPHITLFGGEPLLYKDIERLIVAIKSRGFHLGIITNGTLLKNHARTIVEQGVDVVSLSVDGPGELHDTIRNLEGAFNRIKEGSAAVKALKKELKAEKPVINIVCTISDLNYRTLNKLPEVAVELNADTLNLHHLIFAEDDVLAEHNKFFLDTFGAESKDWAGFVRPAVKSIDTEKLADDLGNIKAKKQPFLLTVYPDFSRKELTRYYTEKDFVSEEYPRRCISPWVVAYIYPNGDVLPCHSLGLVAGNIHQEPFLAAWNGGRMRDFRRKLKAAKHFKVCPKCTEMYRY